MSDDEDASLGVSDGDLSSTDLSDGERGAKDMGERAESPPEVGDPPPLLTGYGQMYIVRKQDPEIDQGRNRQVLFRCGNWCYAGEVSFAGLGDGETINLRDIPRVVPILQRQQDRLKFFCCANRVPPNSVYSQPVAIMAEAQDFVARELSSPRTNQELTKWSSVFPWIDEDSSSSTYFELQAELPACMKGISLVASKTYARGLVFIMIYQEGSFYVVMQDGEGDQALLDIRFPDVSQHGQGLHLMSYDDSQRPWRKLTLWHAIKPCRAGSRRAGNGGSCPGKSPERTLPRTNLTSGCYIQTYVIMKPTGTATFGTNDAYRDVLFRFGSWCYIGTVQLTPVLTLGDIPHVIPALRMQQGKLDFMCDVSQIPSKSPFTGPLERMQHLMPLMEEQVAASEEVLTELMDTLSDMGLEDSVSSWFDGDSMQSFFEFQTALNRETTDTFRGVDLVASKAYSAQGVVTIAVWFDNTYYVVLGEGGEEQPLLDSRFPNVSTKGRGYQIRAMTEGPDQWRELRKVSVWQTAAALQEEMKNKMIEACEKESSDEGRLEAAVGTGADINVSAKTNSSGLTKSTDGRISNTIRGSGGVMGALEVAAVAGGDRAAGGNGGERGAELTAGLSGGSSAEAQPKNSSGIGVCGEGLSGDDASRWCAGLLEEAQHRGRPERDSGNRNRCLGASASIRERNGGVEGSWKHMGGCSTPREQDAKDMAPITHAAAKVLTNTKVALPHHLAPMAGLEDKLRKIRVDMESENNGDAPWDAFGRPRSTLLGAKGHK